MTPMPAQTNIPDRLSSVTRKSKRNNIIAQMMNAKINPSASDRTRAKRSLAKRVRAASGQVQLPTVLFSLSPCACTCLATSHAEAVQERWTAPVNSMIVLLITVG